MAICGTAIPRPDAAEKGDDLKGDAEKGVPEEGGPEAEVARNPDCAEPNGELGEAAAPP